MSPFIGRRKHPFIAKYSQFADAQRHFSTEADLPQHNFTVFYPTNYQPSLGNWQHLPFQAVVADPANPGKPMLSTDPLLFIFDPWFRLLPDVASADALGALQDDDSDAPALVAPSNFGDANL